MKIHNVFNIVDYLADDALKNVETANAPAPIKAGKVFAHLMKKFPIGITSNTFLAHGFGGEYWTDEEAEKCEQFLQKRNQDKLKNTQNQMPPPLEQMYKLFHVFGSNGGEAHTTPDYEKLITKGISGIVDEINAELKNAAHEKNIYLRGMIEALNGLSSWGIRYAEMAEKFMESSENKADRKHLSSIIANCRNLPANPAKTLQEALQSIWIAHIGVMISEHSGASLSWGRMDQYLYPFYLNDLKNGISEEELEETIREFILAMNHSFFNSKSPQMDGACALNIGGVDATGKDLYNPLSKIFIKITKELQCPAPLLAAHIHKNMPQDIFDMLTVPELFQIGQPTFYGEFQCQETLKRRGVPSNEVHKWAANSCMGVMMPAEEWSNMWGVVLNLLLPLELTINNGQPFNHEMPIQLNVEAQNSFESFDQLFNKFFEYTTALADFFIHETEIQTIKNGTEKPNPFVSALYKDCISKGTDRLLGGCRYQTVIVESFGLINASDSLLSIKKLVFEENYISLQEILSALKDNFAYNPKLLKRINSIAKFGNSDKDADDMAEKVSEHFARICARHSRGTLSYAPSFHTLNAHIRAGKLMEASPDGRLRGAPLAKNVGTSPSRNTKGHTSLIISATSIDQAAFFGGQALDISIDLKNLKTLEDRRKFQSLLQTYFELGGLQIQVNAVSREILLKAIEKPEEHRNVIVRIGGFSMPYVHMDKSSQLEMIERFDKGL